MKELLTLLSSNKLSLSCKTECDKEVCIFQATDSDLYVALEVEKDDYDMSLSSFIAYYVIPAIKAINSQR
jgi:hypothetical protein